MHQDVTNAIKDRLQDNIVGPFTIIWCVKHWDATLAFLDVTSSFDARIKFIQTTLLSGSHWIQLWDLLIMPVIYTAIVIVSVELVKLLYYKFRSWLSFKRQGMDIDCQRRVEQHLQTRTDQFELIKGLNVAIENHGRSIHEITSSLSAIEQLFNSIRAPMPDAVVANIRQGIQHIKDNANVIVTNVQAWQGNKAYSMYRLDKPLLPLIQKLTSTLRKK